MSLTCLCKLPETFYVFDMSLTFLGRKSSEGPAKAPIYPDSVSTWSITFWPTATHRMRAPARIGDSDVKQEQRHLSRCLFIDKKKLNLKCLCKLAQTFYVCFMSVTSWSIKVPKAPIYPESRVDLVIFGLQVVRPCLVQSWPGADAGSSATVDASPSHRRLKVTAPGVTE